MSRSLENAPLQTSYIAPDGTVHVRDLTIPPSRLWTEEFHAFQIHSAAMLRSGNFRPTPARNAPAAEWEQFDAWWERRFTAEPLQQALGRYPVHIEKTNIAGVPAAVITPRGGVAFENARRILINLRGGAFVYNRGLAFGQLEAIPVASLGRVKVVTLDYRQAPFHSFPSASEDVEAVYREILKHHSPGAIGIFGCSSGGMLTAQAIPWFEVAGLPRPGAVGIFSIAPMPRSQHRPPWGWDWGDASAWIGGMVPRSDISDAERAIWEPARWYMEPASASDPRAYPGGSDAVLSRFPPTLLLSATRDYACSSVVFTHAKFLKLGVDASLYIMEGGGHGAHVMAVGTPEAHDAQAYVARWFMSHLSAS